jgi:hypothetical protein
MPPDPTSCCTSDYNNDGLLDFQDIRVMYLWIFFVFDKEAPLGEQLSFLEAAYQDVYPTSPAITLTDIPRVVCSDFDDDGVITVVDTRIFYIWVFFVTKTDPLATQLAFIDAAYPSIYPTSPTITSFRIPEVLDPSFCIGIKGWFITPWIDATPENFGWLE